ncbi:MAG: hypothetical protein ICV51_08470 [Flavisolibacter sp.]|nr:hypothetical protein [Flavisolibacter sp.]
MEKRVTAEKIKESAKALRALERSTKGLVRDRVRFIRLLKEDAWANLSEAAQQAGGYRKSWGYNIWNLYQKRA